MCKCNYRGMYVEDFITIVILMKYSYRVLQILS